MWISNHFGMSVLQTKGRILFGVEERWHETGNFPDEDQWTRKNHFSVNGHTPFPKDLFQSEQEIKLYNGNVNSTHNFTNSRDRSRVNLVGLYKISLATPKRVLILTFRQKSKMFLTFWMSMPLCSYLRTSTSKILSNGHLAYRIANLR